MSEPKQSVIRSKPALPIAARGEVTNVLPGRLNASIGGDICTDTTSAGMGKVTSIGALGTLCAFPFTASTITLTQTGSAVCGLRSCPRKPFPLSIPDSR